MPNTASMEAVDFRYLLLDFYKSLGLKENEVMVLLMIDHLLKQGNRLITNDLLSLKMSLKTAEIDPILTSLLKKELISYEDSSKGMKTSLAPLRAKLNDLFQLSIAKSHQNLLSAERAEILSRLHAYFEKRRNRMLSPLEADVLNGWLDDGYTEDEIKNALEIALSENKRTIKAVDKALRTGRKRDDIAAEGYSGVNDTWNADIARTIEIAKARWVRDDEEE